MTIIEKITTYIDERGIVMQALNNISITDIVKIIIPLIEANKALAIRVFNGRTSNIIDIAFGKTKPRKRKISEKRSAYAPAFLSVVIVSKNIILEQVKERNTPAFKILSLLNPMSKRLFIIIPKKYIKPSAMDIKL